MNQECYRKIISGSSKGVLPAAARFILRLLSFIYSGIIRLRNLCYSVGCLPSASVEAAVISIGNITAGGTGKTPLVIWLCNYLVKKNYRCAILTRGYKSKQGESSDEPATLEKGCPLAKIIVNPDRIKGARKAVRKYNSQVIVMDDGFQHRRLKRDLDIVTIDGTRPFGYGWLLPAGLLREPLSSLKRAKAVVITRCDQTDKNKLTKIEQRLYRINPDLVIARTVHKPTCAVTIDQSQIPLAELKGKKIFSFCGIGNPEAFLSTIEGLGFTAVGSKIYNDHHWYTDEDITNICDEAKKLCADVILTTQKDWTKIALLADTKSEIPLAYLMVEIDFIKGFDAIKGLIDRTLADKIPPQGKDV